MGGKSKHDSLRIETKKAQLHGVIGHDGVLAPTDSD
jgi:hypothetical protein